MQNSSDGQLAGIDYLGVSQDKTPSSTTNNNNKPAHRHPLGLTDDQAREVMQDPQYSDLVVSFRFQREQKRINLLLGVLVVLNFVIVVVEEEYRSNILLLANSCLIVVEMGCLVVFYMKEYRRLQLRDPLWRNTPLLCSPLIKGLTTELVLFSLHCPPFLPDVWERGHVLNTLVFLRSYIFLRIFRDRYFAASHGGGVVSQLSQTDLDLAFVIKTTLYRDPFPLALTSLAGSFFILSFCLYMAEKPEMDIGTAIWLAGVTFTTVGYGTEVPHTHVGRVVALLCACLGIIFTALITAIIHRSLTITKTQKQMVLFMMECGLAIKTKNAAANVIIQTFRVAKHGRYKAPVSYRRKLNRLCMTFRKLRRREGMLEIDVLEMLIADPRYVLSQSTLLQQLCQSPIDVDEPEDDAMSKSQTNQVLPSVANVPPIPPSAPPAAMRRFSSLEPEALEDSLNLSIRARSPSVMKSLGYLISSNTPLSRRGSNASQGSRKPVTRSAKRHDSLDEMPRLGQRIQHLDGSVSSLSTRLNGLETMLSTLIAELKDDENGCE